MEAREVLEAVIRAAEEAKKVHICHTGDACPWCKFEAELKERLRYLDFGDSDQD